MARILVIVILLLFLTCLFCLIRYNFHLIALLNSHFGSNLSTAESDSKDKKNNNWISVMWENQIQKSYQNSPLTKNVLPTQIPTIAMKALTKEKFIALSENFTRPIVVKGFLKECPAVQKWNLDFFAKKYGDVDLPVIQDGSIEGHKKYIGSYGAYGHQYIKMKDFIESVKKGKKQYINNVSRIFGLHPELLDDMELEKIQKYTGEDIKNEIHITNIFIGGKGTGTSLHCAFTGNFFYNIKGNKKWYLIDPKYTKYMLPQLSRTGLFAVSRLDICGAKKGDYVLNIPRYEVVLDEGDLLFNPPWWWHAVSNNSEYTIACANRFKKTTSALKNNFLFTLIFASHPIANYQDFHGGVKTREEANLHFDKALIGDILRSSKV